jgi:hypothetical protein
MPRSHEADAVRKREERGAEARAQEKVALQSEVMPIARKRETRASFVATVGEVHFCWNRAMPRNKAEASARAQEKVALQSEVMPNSRFEQRGAEARAQEKVALQSEARASFVAMCASLVAAGAVTSAVLL